MSSTGRDVDKERAREDAHLQIWYWGLEHQIRSPVPEDFTKPEVKAYRDACMRGDLAAVQAAVAAVAARWPTGVTNPHFGAAGWRVACEHGHLEAVKWLEAAFALGVPESRTAGNSALLMAAHNGHDAVIKHLLSRYGYSEIERENAMRHYERYCERMLAFAASGSGV